WANDWPIERGRNTSSAGHGPPLGPEWRLPLNIACAIPRPGKRLADKGLGTQIANLMHLFESSWAVTILQCGDLSPLFRRATCRRGRRDQSRVCVSPGCSADFKSAVSQNCILRSTEMPRFKN